MDAVEFVKASKEMCFSLGCKKCPIHKIKPLGKTCEYFEKENAEKFVEIVEAWWQKNKPKTNFEWFKEWLERNGFPTSGLNKLKCPINHVYKIPSCDGTNCIDCVKWWDEIHEEE